TLTGAAALVALVSPAVGLFAVAVALFGEFIDCLLLRPMPRRLRHDPGLFAQLSRRATLSAAFQAATIAFCVALAWVTAPGESGMFFCLAYLTGASINAGIVLPYHRGAALARLIVYAATVCSLFAWHLIGQQGLTTGFFYNLLGGLMMGYMVVIFIQYVVIGQRREARNSRDLLLQGHELARANTSLREQERETRNLALVARGASDSVIMSDPTGKILWTNDAFTRITGYSTEEAVGRRPADLLNGPETCEATSHGIARAIMAQRPHRAEILNYTKDGRKIWMETNLAPVFNDQGGMDMVIAIERDITAAKAHEVELARAKQAAEQGARAKSRFLATMSHEIRTPMNGILGMADLLGEEKLSSECRLYVDTIRDSAESLLVIINDILDFSKLDAGRMSLNPVPFDPGACIEGVVTLLRPQARAKGITLDWRVEGRFPARLSGDDTRVRQVLVNIIGNAVKFTEKGGVSVIARSQDDGGRCRLQIAVQDTGIGIPQDRRDSIFDQFSQADAATTRRFGGTGLGLAISRLLARSMGGDITVSSRPGAGSCFRITLCLERDQAAPGAPAGAESAFDPQALAGLTVLLAEDNRTNRLLIRKYLKDLPLEIIEAENGRVAVDKARRHNPDIILMDMAMPEMDGIEATRQIRRAPMPQPHIVALTANAYASDRAACLAAGMDAFLSKPVRKQRLLNELASLGAAARRSA
ncbi:ATP-binding protein, partial [Shimia sp.]|uniref:ATP-binding protein n=1 Tax=Shimia sp. TaxID=1954381 RepID=UPI0035685C60